MNRSHSMRTKRTKIFWWFLSTSPYNDHKIAKKHCDNIFTFCQQHYPGNFQATFEQRCDNVVCLYESKLNLPIIANGIQKCPLIRNHVRYRLYDFTHNCIIVSPDKSLGNHAFFIVMLLPPQPLHRFLVCPLHPEVLVQSFSNSGHMSLVLRSIRQFRLPKIAVTTKSREITSEISQEVGHLFPGRLLTQA